MFGLFARHTRVTKPRFFLLFRRVSVGDFGERISVVLTSAPISRLRDQGHRASLAIVASAQGPWSI